MLRFGLKPDVVFHTIIEESLECGLDYLKNEHLNDLIPDELLDLFEKEMLETELEKLLGAHKSSKLYEPTPYHSLIIDSLVKDYIEAHNLCLAKVDTQKIGKDLVVGEISYEDIKGIFYDDEDFLYSEEMLSNLNSADKESAGFQEGIFGVVNKLTPSPEELTLKEIVTTMYEAEGYYKKGEKYPYWTD